LSKNEKSFSRRASLLLHSCCAPCSSAVLERLFSDYEITIYYYNPNIMPAAEYEKRLYEQRRLISLIPGAGKTELIEGGYDTPNQAFLKAVEGLENEREGGRRCEKCIEMRLCKTAETARELGFDFFATTLSVSPHKNTAMINRILLEKGAKHDIKPLCEDFKKKDGYKRSVELSKEYGLYRQGYCGCGIKNH